MSESNFTTSKLSGHKKSINCMLMNPNDDNMMMSGSDDKTVRLWDLRTQKPSKCIAGCFSAGVESMVMVHNNYLCVASEKSLYTFDIRSSGIIVKEPTSVLRGNFEDINFITVHPKDNSIAVADDSGTITIVPVSGAGVLSDNASFNRHKKLSRVHTNIVGAISYRRPNPSELVSGGFDCIGCIWDVARGRPAASVRLEHVVDETSELTSQSQVLNPPFVHALDYCCGGRGIVMGLGDGTVRLLSGRDLRTAHSVEAHGGMITALFAANDLAISGGVDSFVNAWRILEGSNNVNNNSNSDTITTSGKGGKKAGSKSKPEFSGHLEKVWSVHHGSKINAISGRDSLTATLSDALFVADMSSDITVYNVRL